MRVKLHDNKFECLPLSYNLTLYGNNNNNIRCQLHSSNWRTDKQGLKRACED